MKVGKNKSVFQSITVAAGGFLQAVRAERSIQQILIAAVLWIAVSSVLGVPYFEILVMVFAWVIVITFEIFNTALEKAMDYASGKEWHPLIKSGKDFAGASVFVVSSFAWIFSAYVLFRNLH